MMKKNEKMFEEILKKDLEERRETNKKIEKNEDLERKTSMLKANYGWVQAFYERRRMEEPPQ